MDVMCTTNLDLQNERWPSNFRAMPNVGDYIESLTMHCNGFRLRLKVVSITWKATSDKSRERHYCEDCYPVVELHDCQNRSIREFYKWYAPLVGASVSSFI